MADVTVAGGSLQVDLTVPERVLSLHPARVAVALSDIDAVRVVREVLGHVRGLRRPGAGFAGILAIGSWRGTAGGREFRDFVLIHGRGPGLVITTAGAYDRILLGMPDADRFAADLDAARASCGRLPSA